MRMAAVSKVLFNKPIYEEIEAPKPPGRPTQLGYHEIQGLLREIRELGIDERAVVTRVLRHPNGYTNNYGMATCTNWGVVTDLKSTVGFQGNAYFPIKVKWVDGSISEHWPEELFVIHPTIRFLDIDQRIKEELRG